MEGLIHYLTLAIKNALVSTYTNCALSGCCTPFLFNPSIPSLPVQKCHPTSESVRYFCILINGQQGLAVCSGVIMIIEPFSDCWWLFYIDNICKHWCLTVKLLKIYGNIEKTLSTAYTFLTGTCIKCFWSVHLIWLAFPYSNPFGQCLSKGQHYGVYCQHCVYHASTSEENFYFSFSLRRTRSNMYDLDAFTAVSAFCILMGRDCNF